jgi:hypothetical protein
MELNEALAPDVQEIENDEEDTQAAEVIAFRVAKILRLNKNISKLRDEVVSGIKDELRNISSTCSEAKTVIGEINGTKGSHK